MQPVLLHQPPAQKVHSRTADESRHEQVGGPLVNLHRCVNLLNFTAVEHDDPLPQRHRFDLIVGHVDHGRAQTAVQLRDLGAHRQPQLRIEIGQRLIEQENLRITHQRAPECDALALPARELPGPALQQVRQTQHLRGFPHAALDLGARLAPQLQAEAQVLGDRHVRIQGVALEHHRDVTILRRDIVDDAAADTHRAGGG